MEWKKRKKILFGEKNQERKSQEKIQRKKRENQMYEGEKKRKREKE